MTEQPPAWQADATVRFFLDSVRGAIPFAAEQLAVMLAMVAQGRQPVRRFLDVGAGDGILTAVLLNRYPGARATLVDFSSPMLARARERFSAMATPPSLVEADLASSTWLETVASFGPFDAIVSGFAIHHLENQRKRVLYDELFTLLEPGGVFVNIEHVAPEAPWMRRAFDEAMIDAMWQHARRGGPAARREEIAAAYANRDDRDGNRLAPLAAQLGWLGERGFAGVVAPFRWYELAVFGGYRPR